MRFERGLRSVALKPYAHGFIATPTDDVNREDPDVRFGGMKDSGIWVGDQDFPAVIELNVRVTPIWAENTTAIASLDQNASCCIYPPSSVFSKVRIEAVGSGYYQKDSGGDKIPFIGDRFLNYQLDLPNPFLYQKDFLTQPQGQRIQWNSQDSSNQEIPFLWAYGAQQVEDDIHPLVFTLESVRQETCIRPSSLLLWREQGLLPRLIGKHIQTHSVFQDVFEQDQCRTLSESIEAGMSVIDLKIGIDETGSTLNIPYYSYGYVKNFICYKKGN